MAAIAAHKSSTVRRYCVKDAASLARPSCSGVCKEGVQVRLRSQLPSTR